MRNKQTDKHYVIILRTNGSCEVCNILNTDNVMDYDHFRQFRDNCHCELFERVPTFGMYSLLIDEEGLLKDNAVLNRTATCMAHQPIVGDCIVVVAPPNDPDFFYLTTSDVMALLKRFNSFTDSDLDNVLGYYGLQ